LAQKGELAADEMEALKKAYLDAGMSESAFDDEIIRLK